MRSNDDVASAAGDSRLLGLIAQLNEPLTGIRGASQWISWELESKGTSSAECFSRDYVGDLWSWSETMRALMYCAQFFREGPSVTPHLSLSCIAEDIINPAVRQVDMLLRQRRFSPGQIVCQGVELIPRLWIDKCQFQSVFFSLLSNAISYAYHDPAAFQVEIDGARQAEGFVIWCRDWGIGIPEGLEEVVFDEGFRASNASEHHLGGQGLGLWMARQVVEAHGGTLRVTHLSNPTELAVWIPVALQ